MQFVTEIGISEAEFEDDSKTIVAALHAPYQSLTPYGHLIADAKVLANSLKSYCFTHVTRKGNVVAHSLARMSSHINNLEVYGWRKFLHLPKDCICQIFLVNKSILPFQSKKKKPYR
jgi:hypothetical protein